MPATFLSIATTFALLLHTVLGCCWHHAHTMGNEPVATSHVGELGHSGCDGRHLEATPTSEGHDGLPEHEHPSCDEERCLFVSTATSVDVHDCGTAISADVVSVFSGDFLLTTACGLPGPLPEHRFCESAGDHCALIQVWLT